MRDEFEEAEDRFFAYCGYEANINFNVPSVKIALKFSIENDVAHAYRNLNKDNLPFGTHGWNKSYNFPLWIKYIGYYFPELDSVKQEIFSGSWITRKEFVYSYIQDYIFERSFGRVGSMARMVWSNVLPKNSSFIIWGAGIVGVRVYNTLCKLEENTICFFDENKQNFSVKGIQIKSPDLEWAISNNYKIIIASTKYEKAMIDKVERMHLQLNYHYYVYSELKREIIVRYLKCMYASLK